MVVPARRSSSAQRKTQVGAYKKKLGMAAGKKALNIVLLGNNFRVSLKDTKYTNLH